jgi:DNA excision repair protein ERCC-1
MVLLVHVDVEEVVAPLLDITKAAVNCDATLVCAWSNQVRQGSRVG